MSKPAAPDPRPPDVGGCTREWSDKLLWYVNQTIEVGEARQVEAHLAECPDCRGEVAELRAIQEAVKERAAEAPEPSDAVFERVMERIEAYEARRFRPGRLWGRLASWLPSPEVLWQPALRPAVAVAGLVILVQAAAIAGLLTFGAPRPSAYRTLTGPAPTAEAGPKAVIAFRGEATEKDIRSLLREVRANIVDGPGALGVYTVRLPAELRDEAALEEVIARLRARDDLVRFVERVP